MCCLVEVRLSVLVRPARLERGTVMGLSSVTLFLIITNSVFVGTVARGLTFSSPPTTAGLGPSIKVDVDVDFAAEADLFFIPSDISLL